MNKARKEETPMRLVSDKDLEELRQLLIIAERAAQFGEHIERSPSEELVKAQGRIRAAIEVVGRARRSSEDTVTHDREQRLYEEVKRLRTRLDAYSVASVWTRFNGDASTFVMQFSTGNGPDLLDERLIFFNAQVAKRIHAVLGRGLEQAKAFSGHVSDPRRFAEFPHGDGCEDEHHFDLENK